MSNQELVQTAATDLEQAENDYEDVLKSFTQSFEEDNIETEQLRSIPLKTTPKAASIDTEGDTAQPRSKQAPDRQDTPAEEPGTERRRSNSPAPSSSSSSGLTYASLDSATEAQVKPHQAQRQSAAFQATAAFEPILPDELTASRHPTPSSSRAPRPSTNTIPSPFLAATAFPRPSILPVRSGGAAAGPEVSPFQDLRQRQRSDSLEPPRLDLSSPFEKLPIWVERGGEAFGKEDQMKGKGKEREKAREVDIEGDEWTRKFLEADRKLKTRQTQPRESRKSKHGFRSDHEKEHDQDSETFDRRDDDKEGESSDPSQSGRQHRTMSSPFTMSPFEQQDPTPSPSKSKPKRFKNSRKQKLKNRNSEDLPEEDDEPSQSGFSSDRNMTTEKSVAMLPKWRPGRAVRKKRRGNFGVYSEIEEAEEDDEEDAAEEVEGNMEEQEEDDDDEETDYDEPASSALTKSKTYQSKKRAKSSTAPSRTSLKPKSSRKKIVDLPEMTLGDRTNMPKWREIDAYELETEFTL
ncbi:hypothetical protein JCM3765_002762 [Sporobolomyces pararoseus]